LEDDHSDDAYHMPYTAASRGKKETDIMLTTTSSEAMSEAIIEPMIRCKCPKAQRPIAAQTSDSHWMSPTRFTARDKFEKVTSYLRAENLLDAYYQAQMHHIDKHPLPHSGTRYRYCLQHILPILIGSYIRRDDIGTELAVQGRVYI